MAKNKMLRFEIQGLKEAQAALQALGDRAPTALSILVKDFAETQILTPAKEEFVPVDTGNLMSTLAVSDPVVKSTSVSVTVSAGGPAAKYAASVHENPRAGKTGGVSPSGRKYKHWATRGQWKYLETPAVLAARTGLQWFQGEAKRLLKQLGGK